MTHNGREIQIRYQEFPQEIRGAVYGITTAKVEGLYIILIDSTRHPITQRQSLWHELAHVFLNHFEQHDRPLKEQEREANKKSWEYYRRYKAGTLENFSNQTNLK